MLDLEFFTDKIGESAKRLIRKSYAEAKSRDQNQIAAEHVLVSIAEVERPFFNEVMQSLNLDPQVVLQALETKLAQREYIGLGMEMSESFRTLLSNALKQAHESNRRFIEPTDIFVAIFQDKRGFAVELFEQLGSDREMVVQKIRKHSRSRKPSDSQPKDHHRGHQQ
jgi:ATP-dependent Clp protease ATP-binding subunit ClpA